MKFSKFLLSSFLLLLAAGLVICAGAQEKTKKVRGVTGRCEITRHITLEQAENKALQDAKANALRKAGVSEKLWTVTGLISQDDGSEFSQVLSRMTTMQVEGYINILNVKYTVETEGDRSYSVATIDAEVKSGGTVDPTFVLDVNGVDGIYPNGSYLKFTAKVYGHDAYLHLFWFDETGGSVIYPGQYEKKQVFEKEKEYSFPVNPYMQYLMEKLDNSKKFETINLILVATKRDIPFVEEEITFDSLLKWIYAIPADERAAWREAVVIQ